MTNIEHRTDRDEKDAAFHEKLAALERCAVELCLLGYEVTINLENSRDPGDVELIIRNPSMT